MCGRLARETPVALRVLYYTAAAQRMSQQLYRWRALVYLTMYKAATQMAARVIEIAQNLAFHRDASVCLWCHAPHDSSVEIENG